MKVVIIGGVAGGATAAARLRRLDENAEIIIFEKSGYISYANCGLPYFIGGTIEDPDSLTLQTPKSFKKRFNIDARVLHEVLEILPEKKTVLVKNLKNGEAFEESYDKLVLSPGAKPIIPQIEGINGDKIFTLRTVEDTYKIKSFVENQKPKTAIVIGGGFIGVEMAENLFDLGMDVTVVEKQKQLLGQIDFDMASFVHSHICKKGVKIIVNDGISAFSEENGSVVAALESGEKIKADMVILSLGVAPDNTLAKKCGMALGKKGSIAVNSRMQTSISDIYAVGDAVEIMHGVSGEKAVISLAGPANKQGRIAADNICGIDSEYKGSYGSSVIKVFDMTVASTGLNENTVRALGYNYEKAVISAAPHATYYPGGKAMTFKMIFDRDNYKILGAQIVGFDGVDKRIDTLSVAMQAGLLAYQLKDLDLAYAPPYSSAKDPVNIMGYIAENIKNGIVRHFHFEDIEKLLKRDDVTLLDTRTVKEFSEGHIEGFYNIPVDDLRERIAELDKSKPVYVICRSGLRSYISCRILEGLGFEAYNYAGGFRFYESIEKAVFNENERTPCGLDKPCV